MTWLFVLTLCTAGQCRELGAPDGKSYVFESRVACEIEKQFVRVEEVGRLSCPSRPFEFSMVGRR